MGGVVALDAFALSWTNRSKIGVAVPDVKHFDPDVALDLVVRLFWEHGADTTGIADVVEATGLSRSSLYATFGGKGPLYAAALGRYLDQQSRPVFETLAAEGGGLRSIVDFFERLISARCAGDHARWGCLITNAHVAAGRDLPEVQQVLEEHHAGLRAAMYSALESARAQGQLRPGLGMGTGAEALAVLAYGINLRSRAGAEAADLLAGMHAVLDGFTKDEE